MAEHDIAPLGERHGIHNWEYANAGARTGATGFIPTDVGKWAKQTDNGTYWELIDDSPVTWAQRTGEGAAASPFELVVACSDESTPLVAGTSVVTFRMPRAVTLTAVRASLKTAAASGTFTVDINEGGSTILSTKITIDATEETSVTAAVPPVISDSALADDSEITVDIDDDASGDAMGLKIALIGTRA